MYAYKKSHVFIHIHTPSHSPIHIHTSTQHLYTCSISRLLQFALTPILVPLFIINTPTPSLVHTSTSTTTPTPTYTSRKHTKSRGEFTNPNLINLRRTSLPYPNYAENAQKQTQKQRRQTSEMPPEKGASISKYGPVDPPPASHRSKTPSRPTQESSLCGELLKQEDFQTRPRKAPAPTPATTPALQHAPKQTPPYHLVRRPPV